jgi:predicted nucleotidyltransferase
LAIKDQFTPEGTPIHSIHFSVEDAYTQTCDLTLTINSSNTELIPISNINYACNSGDYTISVIPVANLRGKSTITLTITDTSGVSTSIFFDVTVNDPPMISSIPNQSTVCDYSINIPFQLTDNEGGDMQVSVLSSQHSLIPPENIRFTGTNITSDGQNYTIHATASITENIIMEVQPVFGKTGTARIIVTVNDSGFIKTVPFELSVFSHYSKDENISLPGVSESSAVFGDYDNDGDLDIFLSGESDNGRIAKLYQNTGGSFIEDTDNSFTGINFSSVAFGDYDNDGDLDMLMTGSSYNGRIAKLYQNNGGTFIENIDTRFPGVYWSTVAFGDYNNDGDLDILLTGDSDDGKIAKIYQNTDGRFIEDTDIDFPGIALGSVVFGDYDNDEDLDILLSGSSDSGYTTILYKNTGSNFIADESLDLTVVYGSSAAFGDYDNDGDLDIILSGYTGSIRVTKIYNNTGITFTEDTDINITGVYGSSVDFGDYDNDGDLDILFSGESESGKIASVYQNTDGNFIENTYIDLPGVRFGSTAFGDYDNDGDLDILIAGGSDNGKIAGIYRNNYNYPNTSPSAPDNLTTIVNRNTVRLSWSAGSDAQTLSASGLSYNVCLGTSPGACNIISPMSINNHRLIPERGMFQNMNTTVNDLGNGIYYWRVQAIDTAFVGSDFSEESTFVILEINDHFIAEDTTISTINFSGIDAYTQTCDMTLTFDSSNTALIPISNISYSCHSGQYNISVIPVANISGKSTITLTLTDSSGFSTSTSFDIITNDPPIISSIANQNTVCGYSVNVPFQVTDKEGGDMRISVLSSQHSLIPPENISFSGTNITSDGSSYSIHTLALTPENIVMEVQPIVGQSGNAMITIIIDERLISQKTFEISVLPFFTEVKSYEYSQGPFVFGDYDNDRDLDLLLYSSLYKNSGGIFVEDTNINLDLGYFINVSSAFGDYDNDGDLDLLFSQYSDWELQNPKIYKNTGDNFIQEIVLNLPGLNNSTVAFVDYDNDGDLDIFISGNDYHKITKIYQNTDGQFTEDTGINLPGVTASAATFGDYDNDGDLDLLLSGFSDKGRLSNLCRNIDGSFFEDTAINFPDVYLGSSTAFADYDNDGDLDIFITGDAESGVIARLYQNTGGSFTENTDFNIPGVYLGSAAFGDYDNDGDFDLLIAGKDSSYSRTTKLYRNDDGLFNEDTCVVLPDMDHSSVSFADYDNDGDLDIFLSGRIDPIPGDYGYDQKSISGIYRNNMIIQNTSPSAPSQLHSVVRGTKVLLTWSAASDAQTISPTGLNYNVMIGTSPNACDIAPPHVFTIKQWVSTHYKKRIHTRPYHNC